MIETVLVGVASLGMLLWGVLLAVSFAKGAVFVTRPTLRYTLTVEEQAQEIKAEIDKYVSVMRGLHEAYVPSTVTTPIPVLIATTAPTPPEIPKPGGWGKQDAVGVDTPPYIVYTDGGQKKVTYRGENMYKMIVGG